MHRLSAEQVEIADSLDEIQDLFCRKEWTDGLPVIPPTETRVLKMLEGTSRKPDEVLGIVPPRRGELTIEEVAINAVMAGCLPEYMPVVITALEAMLEEKFNLFAVQTTTFPCAPLTIVNGPVANKLNIAAGTGCFGPGWRSNATIGRAIRLTLWNVGGCMPVKGSMSTHGRPSRYTFCIAENEAANPWEPLHVERGFDKDASTVSVLACDTPHNINDHESSTALGILNTVAWTIGSVGVNLASISYDEIWVALCPEHAATIAREGFTKNDVKHFIYENGRIPIGKAKNRNMWNLFKDTRPKWFNTVNDDYLMPMVEDWEKVMVIVAGGAGKHSVWLPTIGNSKSTYKEIKP